MAENGTQLQLTDASALADKTVFLRVSFGIIGNTRKVAQDVLKDGNNTGVPTAELPEAAQAEAEAANFDKDRLKVTKMLLDSTELKAIRKADTRIKSELRDLCLPAPIKGAIMVPYGMMARVFEILKAYQDIERPALVKAFKLAYPDLKARAKASLGPLFNEADYPTEETLLSCFTFEYHFVNFGAPGQLKAISPEMYKAATEKAEQVMVEAANEAKSVMRATMLEMVTTLKDSLTPDEEGKPKRLYKSSVTNLQAFLENFDIRNVTNDAELANLKTKLKGVISGVNAEQLKSSDTFRESVLTELKDVTTTLSTMVEIRPDRVFKDIE